MTIKEIVEMEKAKVDVSTILLFREGIFLKAYEQSAFLFHRFVKAYQVKNVYYKVIKGTLLSLGFPSHVLEGLAAEFHLFVNSKQKDIYEICSETIVYSEDEYSIFRDEYSKLEPVVRYREQAKAPPRIMCEIVDMVSLNQKKVISQLQNFNLACSTPMECMIFLNNLKKEMA